MWQGRTQRGILVRGSFSCGRASAPSVQHAGSLQPVLNLRFSTVLRYASTKHSSLCRLIAALGAYLARPRQLGSETWALRQHVGIPFGRHCRHRGPFSSQWGSAGNLQLGLEPREPRRSSRGAVAGRFVARRLPGAQSPASGQRCTEPRAASCEEGSFHGRPWSGGERPNGRTQAAGARGCGVEPWGHEVPRRPVAVSYS